MFDFFKKKRWICDEAVSYLMSLPKLYRVYYTVNCNGRSTNFLFRDENGKAADNIDWFAKDVKGLAIQYQEDGEIKNCYIDEYIGKDYIPYIQEHFDKFLAKYPPSKSNVNSAQLYDMQFKLREEIERVTNVRGAYDGKDIVYNLSGITSEERDHVVNLLRRLDKSCVPVTVLISVTGATDEEIGATLNELAMLENDCV